MFGNKDTTYFFWYGISQNERMKKWELTLKRVD